MNSKERVMTAVGHKTPDRVPRNLGVVPEVAEKMREILQVESFGDVIERLGIDMRHIGAEGDGPLHFAPRACTHEDGTWEDIWGIQYRSVPNVSGGIHEEVLTHPLVSATTAADVERYPWPSPDVYRYDRIESICAQYSEYALFGGYAHFYCPGADLRSYGQWLMDLAEESALAHAMLAKMEEFWLEYSTRVYEAASGKLDIFYMADDYGMQDRMLISPACWRRVFKPIVKRFMDWAHARGLKTMLHSCGSIRPIIPDLIECGLDILDPIQPLANGMNPFELKREFGKDLCFHGGVDIQELLPHGKPQEVREAVKRLSEEVGKDGGYILAPAHQVQSDVPAENVLAIFLDPH